jgi:hypothetical protein
VEFKAEGTAVAQRVVVLLVDDLDGGQADETVSFALDGEAYEIDLGAANAARLRDRLARFMAAARQAGNDRSAPGAASAPSAPRPSIGREQNQAIRKWARNRGILVSDRGRIPVHILEAYNTRVTERPHIAWSNGRRYAANPRSLGHPPKFSDIVERSWSG